MNQLFNPFINPKGSGGGGGSSTNLVGGETDTSTIRIENKTVYCDVNASDETFIQSLFDGISQTSTNSIPWPGTAIINVDNVPLNMVITGNATFTEVDDYNV